MRGSKVASKGNGKIRRNNPVVQTTFEWNEELYRAFSNPSCNKCFGTGRRAKITNGVSIDQRTGKKYLLGNFVQPCKCVPMCLFGY